MTVGTEKLVRVAAYCRVSTLLNQSPDLQVAAISDFAHRRGFALEASAIYVDQGVSGKTERRPSLDRMVKDAKAGKFDILIVSRLDRLGRSAKHLLNLIDDLAHWNVSFISLAEQIDLTSPIGRMTLAVLSSVAQLERDIISERIKTAIAAKRLIAATQNADWCIGRPRILSSDLVQKVKDLRRSGHSTREVCSMLSLSKGSVQRAIQAGPQTL